MTRHRLPRHRSRVPAPLVVALVATLSASGCASGAQDEPRRTRAHTTGTEGWWSPEPGQQWEWQLSGRLDTSLHVPVYDVDWQTPAQVVDDLHAQGSRVICYVSVGTWEEYRDDSSRIPDDVVGRPLEDWPDERWLDIRQRDVLAPVLLERLDTCKEKGFDAVEPDNVDAFANDSGFPLTADDQLAFNRWIADEAHARGLGVGLKNDLKQVPQLVDDFDFAVNEQCLQYDECDRLEPFVQAGKAVLHAEYELTPKAFCQRASVHGFSSILKRYELDSWRVECRDGAPVAIDGK